jgi:hypothetical protein
MQWNDGDGGVNLTGAPWHPGDGNRRGGPWQLRWGPALRVVGEGCTATGTEGLDGFGHIAHREGGSTAARAWCGDAPVDKVWCRWVRVLL